MNVLTKSLIGHEGIHMLAIAMLCGFLVMTTIPEPFLSLSNSQKKEFLKGRLRRLRRKSEDLFDLDDDENECY